MRYHDERSPSRWIYRAAVALALFTGFGNMPLYGRYYIGDLPLLAWSGDFLANVKVHYVAGAILVAMGVYYLITYFRGYARRQLTAMGRLRALLLALTLLSGLVMALKNLPGVFFPMGLLVSMNFLHMGAAVFFMLASLGALILRAGWLRWAR